MTTTTTPAALTRRDRAVLLAVRAGRCEVSGGAAVALTVDGLLCSDQFLGRRLVQAGLIASPAPAPQRARLTVSGRTVLGAV